MAVDLFELQGVVSINTSGADSALTRVDRTARATAVDLERVSQAGDQAGRGLTNTGQAAQRTGTFFEQFRNRLSVTGGGLQELERRAAQAGGALFGLGSLATSVGVALSAGLTVPLGALARAAVNSATAIDQQVNTLKALVGSATAAETRLASLQRVAQATPGLTTNLAATLDAQLRVADVTQRTIDRILPGIGKLNAVAPLGDPGRFAQNLIQLVTQNFEKIDLKEMVGQSPLSGELLKQIFGVSSAIDSEAIRQQAQKLGLTTTEAFFAAFANAAQSNRKLAGITESLGSQFDKLQDRVSLALRPLGLAIIENLKPLVDVAVPFIERLSQSFASLSPGAQRAVLALGLVAASLGPLTVVIGGGTIALGSFLFALGPITAALGLVSGAAATSTVAVETLTAATVTAEAAAVTAASGWASFATGVTAAGGSVAATAAATTVATEATATAAAGFSLFNPVVLGVAAALGVAALAYYAYTQATRASGQELATQAEAARTAVTQYTKQTDELEGLQQATYLTSRATQHITDSYNALSPAQQARVRLLGQESGAADEAHRTLNGLVEVLKAENAERQKLAAAKAAESAQALAASAQDAYVNSSVLATALARTNSELDTQTQRLVEAERAGTVWGRTMYAPGRSAAEALRLTVADLNAQVLSQKALLAENEAQLQTLAHGFITAAAGAGLTTEAFINQSVAAAGLRDRLMELATTVPTVNGQPDQSSPNYQPFTLPPKTPKPKGSSAGDGENPLLKAAKAELDILRVAADAAKRISAGRLTDAAYYYEQALTDLTDYTQARQDAENSSFAAALQTIAGERAVLAQQKLTSKERLAGTLQINEREAALRQEHAVKLMEIERDAAARRRDAERQAWEDKTSLLRETAQGFQTVYQAMANQGQLTFSAAQQAIAGRFGEIWLRVQRDLENQLQGKNPGSFLAQQLQASLNLVRQQIANFNAETGLAQQEANRRDVEREQSHAARLRSIYGDIEAMQRDSSAAQLRLLENNGVRRSVIWQAQAALELEAEQASTARRRTELEAERAFVAQFEGDQTRKAESVRALTAELEALEQASALRRGAIAESLAQKQRQEFERMADAVGDSFERALGKLKTDGLGGFFKSLGTDLLKAVQQASKELFKQQLATKLGQLAGVPQADTAGQPRQLPGLFGALQTLFGGQQNEAQQQASLTATPIVSAVNQSGANIVQALQSLTFASTTNATGAAATVAGSSGGSVLAQLANSASASTSGAALPTPYANAGQTLPLGKGIPIPALSGPGGSALSAILNKDPVSLLSSLTGKGGLLKNLGGLFKPGGGSFLSKLGGLFGFGGGGGAAQGGGFLSKLGGLFGLGGGGGAASGGAAAASGLAAAIPFIGLGVSIGLPFLMKLFQPNFRKSLRGLIAGEYGLQVKDNSILDAVKQTGESKFGKDFPKRQIETVRLPDVRELLYEYAQSRGLKGNSKLFSAALVQDPFSAMNIQKRARGGIITGPGTGTSDSIPAWLSAGEGIITAAATRHYGGAPFINMLNRMELPRFAQGGVLDSSYNPRLLADLRRLGSGTSHWAKAFRSAAAQYEARFAAPLAPGPETRTSRDTGELRDAAADMRAAAADFRQATNRLGTARPGDIVTVGLNERPEAATRAVAGDFARRTPESERIRTLSNKR